MKFTITINIGKDTALPNQLLTRTNWNRIKAIVRKRDGAICWICQEKAEDGTADHLTPLSKGGTDDLSNLAWVCLECNSKRGDTEVEEWLGLHGKPRFECVGWGRRFVEFIGKTFLGGNLPVLWSMCDYTSEEWEMFYKKVEQRKAQKLRSWLRCQIWDECRSWEDSRWLPPLKKWSDSLEYEDSIFAELDADT